MEATTSLYFVIQCRLNSCFYLFQCYEKEKNHIRRKYLCMKSVYIIILFYQKLWSAEPVQQKIN